MLHQNKDLYQYLTVHYDEHFNRGEMFMDIKNEPPCNECKVAHLDDGTTLMISVARHSKGDNSHVDYAFKVSVPLGTCIGKVLLFLDKHYSNYV